MRLSLFILSLSAALLVTAFVVGQNADTASAQETVTVTMGPATGPDGGGSSQRLASSASIFFAASSCSPGMTWL